MEAGQKVKIVLAEDHPLLSPANKWFPKDGATGTVQRIFKNGNVAVAVNELRNFSEDGKVTLHFKATQLEVLV